MATDSPERFRVEMLFSSGANYGPADEDHALSTKPRIAIHRDDALTLHDCQAHLRKWGTRRSDNGGAPPGPKLENGSKLGQQGDKA